MEPNITNLNENQINEMVDNFLYRKNPNYHELVDEYVDIMKQYSIETEIKFWRKLHQTSADISLKTGAIRRIVVDNIRNRDMDIVTYAILLSNKWFQNLYPKAKEYYNW